MNSCCTNALLAPQTASTETSYSPEVDPLLTVKQASVLVAMSVPTFWRRVADGTIPKPVKLGALSRWPRSEILAVIEVAKARR